MVQREESDGYRAILGKTWWDSRGLILDYFTERGMRVFEARTCFPNIGAKATAGILMNEVSGWAKNRVSTR